MASPRILQHLQTLQERDELVLLCSAQSTVVVDHPCRLSAMTQNRIIAREAQQVMHETAFGAQSPQ